MTARFLSFFVAAFLVFAPALDALAKSSSGGSRGSFSSGGSRSSGSSSSSGSSGWSSSSKPSGTTSSQPSGSGSSSGFSSGTSSSGSASGGSGWSGSGAAKPAAPATTASPSPSAPAQSQGTGWSNTTGATSAQGSKPGSTSAFSSSGSDAVKRQSAATSYKDYQGQFGKSGNAVPNAAPGERPILNPNRSFNSYQDYGRYRDNYYAGRGWSAPGYAFGSFSSFGMWDAMFMWFMLSQLSGPSFFHNHQNDPGVQAFQKEAQKLSESNADLKKQVQDLNVKLDEMKKSGTPVDPTAMPPDVDPNVATAKPKIAEQAPASSSGPGWLMPAALTLAAILGIGFFMTRRNRA